MSFVFLAEVPGPGPDLISRAIYAAVDHWLLVVALAISAYWLFPKALATKLPEALGAKLPEAMKAYFTNGGGDLLRVIVKSENERQSEQQKKELELRFAAQAAQFRDGEHRFAQLESRLENLEDERRQQRRRRG